MAKRDRNRNLAGLAALGALGYHLANSKQTVNAPVEYRGEEARRLSAAAAAPALADSSSDFESQIREHEGGIGLQASTLGRAPAAVAPTRSMAPTATAATAAIPAEVPSRGRRELPPRRNVAGDYTRRMGATADEIAAYRTREITPPPMTPEMRRQAEAQALERVYPETLYGGPGLKGLHAAAKALANRPPALREVTQQALPAPTARLTGPSKTDLMARDRAARAATQREEMLQENARRYGLDPNAPGYEATARALREGLGGGAFTLKKKGGMVKAKAKKMASGGSTSSASKRGDGIAQRGKTKCKMY